MKIMEILANMNKNKEYRDFFEKVFFTQIVRSTKTEADEILSSLNKNFKLVIINSNVFILLNQKPFAAFLGGGSGLRFADEKITTS